MCDWLEGRTQLFFVVYTSLRGLVYKYLFVSILYSWLSDCLSYLVSTVSYNDFCRLPLCTVVGFSLEFNFFGFDELHVFSYLYDDESFFSFLMLFETQVVIIFKLYLINTLWGESTSSNLCCHSTSLCHVLWVYCCRVDAVVLQLKSQNLTIQLCPCLNVFQVFIESYDRLFEFLKRSKAVSPAVALETATALQVTCICQRLFAFWFFFSY